MTGPTTQHGHRPNHGLVRMTDTQLPKLPEPEGYADPAYGAFAAFTADQMRAYASEAVRAYLQQMRHMIPDVELAHAAIYQTAGAQK